MNIFGKLLTLMFVTAGILLAGANRGGAGESSVAIGQEILRQNCSRCHAIGPTGASPFAPAPPFREVVKRYDPADLEEALAEGIVTGHPKMPEFTFDPDQIGAIVAYLTALRG